MEEEAPVGCSADEMASAILAVAKRGKVPRVDDGLVCRIRASVGGARNLIVGDIESLYMILQNCRKSYGQYDSQNSYKTGVYTN